MDEALRGRYQAFFRKATYRRTFEIPDFVRRAPRSALRLDLGKVRDLATVRVNGQQLGTLWLPPYRVDMTAAVKPGANTREVDVVNTGGAQSMGQLVCAGYRSNHDQRNRPFNTESNSNVR